MKIFAILDKRNGCYLAEKTEVDSETGVKNSYVYKSTLINAGKKPSFWVSTHHDVAQEVALGKGHGTPSYPEIAEEKEHLVVVMLVTSLCQQMLPG